MSETIARARPSPTHAPAMVSLPKGRGPSKKIASAPAIAPSPGRSDRTPRSAISLIQLPNAANAFVRGTKIAAILMAGPAMMEGAKFKITSTRAATKPKDS